MELLVAMAVVGVLLGAVYGIFINFLSNSAQQAALGKRGFDIRVGLTQMRQDLASAGFGIRESLLGEAVAGTSSSLTIRSTSVSGRAFPAGQYGVFQSGNVSGISNTTRGVALNGDRDLVAGPNNLGSLTGVSDGRLFFAGNQDGAQLHYFQRQFRLSNTVGNQCASGTNNLQWEDYPAKSYGSSSPIIGCVLNFRVYYGFRQNGGGLQYAADASASPGNPENLHPDILKVGLMVQTGERYRGQTVSPATMKYTDPVLAGGGEVNLDATQRQYNWKRVEWSIPLANMTQ